MSCKSVLSAWCVLAVQLWTTSAEQFVCPATGRFPNPESLDCRSYLSCALTVDQELIATVINCPAIAIFNWDDNKCVSASTYTCPMSIASTTTVASTESTTTETNGFICPSTGRYPNPESLDCRSYYSCALTDDNELIAMALNCPASSIFNWDGNKCVSAASYTCPNAVISTTTSTTTTSTTTTEPTTTPEPTTTAEPEIGPGHFSCQVSGRFPDPDQADCQTYKYCLQTAVNTFQEYTFRCPAGSKFSPTESRCSVGYVCQRAEQTTTTTEAPTTNPAAQFVCNAEGRFADPESCSQYTFCARSADGGILKYVFKCPPNSGFNPNENRCSASYVCN